MPTERENEIVLSKEVNVFVNKGTSETPNWVMVGCATGKDHGYTVNTLTANCDNGTLKVDSGEDPEFDLQLSGLEFAYASANEATNVSYREFYEWGMNKVVNQYRIAGKYTGDLVITFWGIISTLRNTGNNGEIRAYNVNFAFREKPVLSDQT